MLAAGALAQVGAVSGKQEHERWHRQAAGAAGVGGPCGSAGSAAAPLRVNGERLRATLEGLSRFGRPAGGSFADGVSRTAYSDADIAGRAYVIDLMRQAGLNPRIDAAGNILGAARGHRQGPETHHHRIAHRFGARPAAISTAMSARWARWKCCAPLMTTGSATRHPIEMAIWSNEEGGTVGSTAFAGALAADALENSYYGIPLPEA